LALTESLYKLYKSYVDMLKKFIPQVYDLVVNEYSFYPFQLAFARLVLENIPVIASLKPEELQFASGSAYFIVKPHRRAVFGYVAPSKITPWEPGNIIYIMFQRPGYIERSIVRKYREKYGLSDVASAIRYSGSWLGIAWRAETGEPAGVVYSAQPRAPIPQGVRYRYGHEDFFNELYTYYSRYDVFKMLSLLVDRLRTLLEQVR